MREYTADSKEALRIRKEAEIKYYGYSEIEKYEEMMHYELEEFRREYLAKKPPKVEGIYYNTTEQVWNARLWHDRALVYDKTFPTRAEAVKGADNDMDESTKTLLYETLELLREAIMKSGCYSDWKDADDYLFAELGFTKAELLEIYKGKETLVYIGSAVED